MIAGWRRTFALASRRTRRLLVLVLVVALLGIGGYLAYRRHVVQTHLRAAEQAMARYQFDEAMEHLAAILQARPHDAQLHLRMARAARLAGRPQEAAEHLDACRRLGGAASAVALERLLLRAQSGDLAGVEGPLMERVQVAPDDEAADIFAALAQGLIRGYRLDGSMYCLNELLKRRPDDPVALLERGSLWEQLPDEKRAEADYRRAVEAQPDFGDARCRLGDFLINHGQPAEALRHFEHARQLPRGGQPRVLLGVARCREELGQPDQARQVFDELLQRYPHQPEALVARGSLALENESPAVAEEWLRRAVAEDPFNPQTNYLLAQSLRRQGKEEEAQPYETAHARIKEESKRLQDALGRVKKSPRDPEPRREVGLICLRNGQQAEGERWLLSALQIAPDHAPTRADLADFYQRNGKPELAQLYRSAAP